jgi:hypothetical protein
MSIFLPAASLRRKQNDWRTPVGSDPRLRQSAALDRFAPVKEASLAFAAILALAALPANTAPGPPTDAERADLLMVVDCLLPGQVRNLGRRSTYISARRPARLTARDCQIRGGEYVAFDRADFKSALGAWLPLAEKGDQEARVIVGEIYERGLGVEPDFAAAARWYRLAADDGSRRAQINLGHLYEQGLGVAQDPTAALDWYRRAAGRDAAIELDLNVAAEDGALRAALEQRTRELEQSLAELQLELGQSRDALSSMENRASAAESKAAAAETAAAAARARAEAAAGRFADATPAAPDRSAEIEALQRELARRMTDAEQLAHALDEARAENGRRLATLAQASQETTMAREAAAAERQRLEEATVRLAAREKELSSQRAETERLGRELAAATALAAEHKAAVERLEQPVAARLLAGPELVIVEPALTATRDIVPVAAAAPGPRHVIGRVTAPAGLVTVTVNDVAVTPNEFGVFRTTLPAPESDAPVVVAAVDRQGKRGEARFMLRAVSLAPAPVVSREAGSRALASQVDFGTYHALVIGNNDYRTLPDLSSPVNDATELAELLKSRYGFRTTVLLNADRYQILSALNVLRETLTPADNLLIYFAGHGELDEVNQRGHWLPVDAERDSTANWIPTTAVTDILNIMRAKQIMLVVDSCYAGALTRSSVARLSAGMTADERLHWLKTMATRRSRTVLTSGGLAPVMDAGGGRHSVFAKALLEVLASNTDAIDGQRLHREVAARVAYAAANMRFDQVPEYAPIRFAGHESGEFFLIPEF